MKVNEFWKKSWLLLWCCINLKAALIQNDNLLNLQCTNLYRKQTELLYFSILSSLTRAGKSAFRLYRAVCAGSFSPAKWLVIRHYGNEHKFLVWQLIYHCFISVRQSEQFMLYALCCWFFLFALRLQLAQRSTKSNTHKFK